MCDQLLTHDKLSEITRLVDEFLNLSRERDALAGDGKLKIDLQLADWGTPDLDACNEIAQRPDVQLSLKRMMLSELNRRVSDLERKLRELGFDVSSIDTEQ